MMYDDGEREKSIQTLDLSWVYCGSSPNLLELVLASWFVVKLDTVNNVRYYMYKYKHDIDFYMYFFSLLLVACF